VQLRDAGFVHADLATDLLHRDFAVVVEADDLPLAPGQRVDRGAHALLDFASGVRDVGPFRFGRQQDGGEHRLVAGLGGRKRRRRFNRGDPHDRAAQTFFIASELRRQVRDRRLAAVLATQLLASGFELTPLAADAAGPRVLSERVDHRAADAAFGERLELDPARLVEAVRRVDETEDAILHEIPQVDRVRHRRRHSPGQRLYEGKSCDDPVIRRGSDGLE